MESQVKRTQRDYTLAFKLAVVAQVEKGELTYKAAQQRYGIQGRSTVLVWLRKHGRQNWNGQTVPFVAGGKMANQQKTVLAQDKRIKQLEIQLREASEKARLFDAMLDVLKNDYGISIAKKPSGKSSRKNESPD